MRIMLNVPYQEKDEAKKLGAKFDWKARTWYYENISETHLFERWLNKANIICENLYILGMSRKCYRCGESSQVVLLATDRSYASKQGYALNTNMQILTYVTWVPRKLSDYLFSFGYYPSYSRTIDDSYYMNHCSVCDSTQGDYFLHEVPSQAFYKHLLYQYAEPCDYTKIENRFCIPIAAELPYYDETSSDWDLLMYHLDHPETENRASLMVTQKEVNQLLVNSIEEAPVYIEGI